jgi:1,4-alpha-glucan branching enzyme
MYEKQFNPEGFEWVEHGDWENSVLAYLRKGEKAEENLLVVCNFTPTTRQGFRVGVPAAGKWKEVLSSDAKIYNGTGDHLNGTVKADKQEWNGQEHSIEFTLPPLATVIFQKV